MGSQLLTEGAPCTSSCTDAPGLFQHCTSQCHQCPGGRIEALNFLLLYLVLPRPYMIVAAKCLMPCSHPPLASSGAWMWGWTRMWQLSTASLARARLMSDQCRAQNSLKVSCRLVRTSHTTSSCTFPTLILCCCFLFWHFSPLPIAGAGCHSATPEQRPASLGDASGRAIFSCRLAVAQFRSMLRGQS